MSEERAPAGFRLSPQQRRLWRFQERDGTLHTQTAFLAEGEIDRERLRRSFERAAGRHEVFRTLFRRPDGWELPLQVVQEELPVAYGEADLAERPAADGGEAALRELFRRDREAGLDLEKGPLLRLTVARLAPDRHVLCVTTPTLCGDARTHENLIAETGLFYDAGGETAGVREAIQYVDVSEWQHELLGAEDAFEGRRFWRGQLPAEPAGRRLFGENGHDPAVARVPRRLAAPLGPELLERVEGLARERRVRSEAVLLAAWLALLSRSGLGETLAIGRLDAGRGDEVLAGAQGLLARCLPLRFQLDARHRFADLLAEVERALAGAEEWREVLSWEDLGDPPLPYGFEHRSAAASRRLGGARLSPLCEESALEPFTVQLKAVASGRGLDLELWHDAARVPEDEAELLLERLAALLEDVLDTPAARLGDLAILGAADRRRLAAWNDTALEVGMRGPVHRLFEAQAARTPEAEALVWGGERLTYGALNAWANRLARRLLRAGSRPGGRVVLALERSTAQIVALLASWKAGAAFVPLDPLQPAPRLARMLEDTTGDGTPAVVVTTASLAPLLPATALPRVVLDGLGDLSAESAADLPVEVPPEAPAYVLFTSGSTGRPKGAVIRHCSVVNMAEAFRRRVYAAAEPAGRPLRVSLSAPLAFDGSIKQIVQLAYGHALFLVPEEARRDAAALVAFVREHRLDVLDCTPAQAGPLLDAGLFADAGSAPRLTLLGGDKIVAPLWERLSGCPERIAYNLYGPTECTVDSTAERVGAVPFPSIGRSFPNVRIWVVDEALQPVPPEIWGEILIGGAGLALGYVGRPDLTAERFLPDPFAAEPGGRLYRTGDRGRFLRDGRLVCHGRLDDQVKLRGFRIELGEIEAALAEHPGVARAVAVLREDGDGGAARLVAYAIPRTADRAGAGPLPPGRSDVLRDFTRRRLPDFMVPSAVVVLSTFPLTRNGKVDRAALPAPEDLRSAATRPVLAPRNPFEERLAGIWAELLRVPRVGVDESFFDLGGDSLLATRLVSRVREAFRADLPLRALFEGPTVAGLAERVRRAVEAGPEPGLPPIRPVPRGGGLPLSFAQQRLWFLWQLEPDSPAYNNSRALRIRGPLDVAAVRRTLDEIARRHEVLRTTYGVEEGRPVQRIAPAARIALPVEDLSHLAEREERARRALRDEVMHPFDLARDFPLRGRLLRLGARDHVLLLTSHHIASDAWSLGVLEREVSALYGAFSAGRPSPLPELPVQYADFAGWQREWLRGEVLERQLAYWRERLAGAPPVLDLPLDRLRPPVASPRGELLRFSLPAAPSRSLAELGERRSLTLFMVLMAGFQTLLARSSGQSDLSVGTPIAGRRHVEIEGLIGCFINTLVLRGRLDRVRTFGELLDQVRDLALSAYAHQDLPFERLVDELSPERSLSHMPLFQAMLILQNVERSGVVGAGLELSSFGVEAGVARFDLLLSLAEEGGDLRGLLEYRTDLFDRTTIARLAGHLAGLLESAAAAPETPWTDLALLTPAEHHQLRAEWNDTAAAPGPGLTLLERIEEQVKRAPGAVAVACEGEALTYAELARRAEALARRLARLGVGPEARVAICAERSPRLLVAVLGVLAAGGAWVPLDPAHPRQRLGLILEDCGARILLSERPLSGLLSPCGATVVLLDGEPGEEAAPPLYRARPENLAYVIYTSGSTGRPKGVEVRHQGLANYLASMAARPGLGPGDVVAAVTTVAFDIAVTELLLPLTVGARIELVSRRTAGDAALLAAALESCGATCLQATPATWTLLVEGGWPGRPGLRALCGGEALPRSLADRLLPRVAELWNVYGPTETTVWSAALQLGPGEGTVPVGSPLANTTFYLLGPYGEPVPLGVMGELAIGGDGLARGYRRRPDLTAERFVPDPFGAPGARLYRTGDLARRLPDGTLELLGRIDHQVKVRGFRIEPGEIEAVLLEQPGIREAVVVAREDRPGDRRLVAYVAGDAVESSVLRERLGRRLPAVMVPAAFVALGSLPKNPNGKIDRRALPAPEEPGSPNPGAVPRDPLEEVIADLWAELLGRPRVGVDESFFALGGNSLLATRLVSRLREVFGIELRVRALFEGPTVAELARRVREAVHAGAGLELPPIRPLPRDRELPLSFAQQRLWFLGQLEPESPAYNQTGGLRIRGPLDVAAAGHTLSEIVRRHEVLRTTFPAEAGRPVQRIGPASALALPVEDLSALPAAEERAREGFRAEARRPFDLARETPLRARLLRLGPGDHVLLLTTHHIASDAWSMAVLEREVTALYDAFAAGRPSPLPELPVQYADFAGWQREWLRGEVLERQLAYWREQLAGAPPVLPLLADRPRPPVASPRGERLAFPLPAELSRSLTELGRRRSLTRFMVLLAGFQALLARLSGETDVSVGTPIAGRRHVATEGLIGFFVNTLVLRGHLDRARTFEDLLGQARELALSAYTHQDLPFERLVDELAPERSLGHTPLFQVMLVLQNVERSGMHAAGLELSSFGGEPGVVKLDLLLSLIEEDGGLRGELDFRTGLFDRTTAVRLAGHLVTLLESAVAAPQTRWADLALLNPAERHQIIEWNDTDASGTGEATLHGLVEAQRERTPEAVAVVFGEESLSYAELGRRAGWLAWRLRRLGVGPEVRVGICAERSLELVIGLLGILEAGGAYVPLDPDHPDARLAWVLADSHPPAVLAQGVLGERIQGLLDPTVSLLDFAAASVGEGPAPRLGGGAGADNAAYVLFTSGSTGRPKGVVNTHRGIINRLLWMEGAYGLTAADRVLQKTPFGFDVSVAEIFGPLLAGARLVVAAPGGHQDSAYLARALAESGITQVHFVPSMLRALLEEPELDAVSGLRRVIASGEALPPDLAQRFHERLRLRGAELHNLYGPTEAAVEVTFHACRPGEKRVPIGRPVARTRILLLDRDGGPVPVGVAGELHIGGVQVARGYLGQPDLTAERFVPDPWGEAGARLYRTGDLARHLPDGEVEYLGRIDRQVKLRGVRIELGEVEAALRAEPGIREAVAVVREDRPGDRRLVAYVAGEGVEITALRERLGDRLPSSMVPALFVALDSLPLGPSGKIDRRALPAPGPERPEARAGFAAPVTPAERTLATIWSQVLGIERIGRYDDFFELGGDSILSLQIVARAHQVGLRLAPRQLFQHPTVAGLAAAAACAPAAPGSEPGPDAGPVPLTPIQHWFFERGFRRPSHFNQSVLLEVRRPLAPAVLEQVALDLLAHHDALRLRFVPEPTGWRQEIGGMPRRVPFFRSDLSALPRARRRATLEAVAAGVQAGLDLERGSLARFVLFHLGAGEPDRLLIVVHHLAVDGVSWRVLLEDLHTACEQRAGGSEARLPPRTASFQRWARSLATHARSEAVRGELAFWRSDERRLARPLPVDRPERRAGAEAGAALSVSLALGPEETRALLQEVPKAYRTRIDEVLLTALARAFEDWTGETAVLVDLEWHGREETGEDLDVSRTVGWFTTLFPVLLDTRGLRQPGELLKSVKEQVRALPGRGLGYGLLRYLSGDPEIAAALRELPQAQVLFNFLGQTDQVLAGSSLFAPARESAGPARDPAEPRRHRLEITGIVAEGRLRLAVRAGGRVYRRDTLAALAEGFRRHLRALIEQCLLPGAGGYTPSDFPLLRTDQRELDLLLAGVPGVEDAYPLSPMQEGMLFHSLFAGGSDVYVTQARYDLERLDLEAFRSAWEAVLARQPVLRTGFHAAGGSRTPVQVVRRAVPLPLRVEEGRGLPAAEREAWLAALARSERQAGFDLSRPPLMRLVLARLSESGYHLVWTHHHLLLDGWSVALLLSEVSRLYRAFSAGRPAELPPVRPYRDYIAFLERCDGRRAEELWRQTLAGFEAPTPLPGERRPEPTGAAATEWGGERLRWPAASLDGLEAFARRHRLTVSTLVHGAWALLLGRSGGRDDVVFGSVTSGRPAELPDMETAIGLFINTLPVRVRMPSGAAVLPWLRSLQEDQTALREVEHTPLREVQRASGLPAGTPLFESLLIFENYPVDEGLGRDLGGLAIRRAGTYARTSYPLNLVAVSSGGLSLALEHDARRFDPVDVRRSMGHLARLLLGLAEDGERPLADLPMLAEGERHQILSEWNDPGALPPGAASVVASFERVAERMPDRPALSQDGRRFTYGELDRWANRLACALCRRGVGMETRVAVLADRSPELIVALLGILKAGGVYVPLDPEYPRDRLAFMLEDSGAAVLLTREGLAGPRLRGSAVPFLFDAAGALDGESDERLPAGLRPDQLAYVIYTSGSTGRPKGVMVSHGAFARLAEALRPVLRVEAGERVLQFCSPSFDASLQEIVSSLTAGGELVLRTDAMLRSARALLAACGRESISVLSLPAAYWHEIAAKLEAEGLALPSGLRLVFTGGERALPERVAAWHRHAPEGPRLINGYGVTESTVLSTAGLAAPAAPGREVSVGRVLAHTEAYILDRQGRPVPVGVAGELHLGGDLLARGYLNRPEQTAERFVPHPFPPVPGARLYRTGDRARAFLNGEIELLGRVDRQVKVRGYRIEVEEIEARLLRHPEVEAARVVVREDPRRRPQLVAYVVPRESPGPEPARLRAFLRETLPDALVPGVFVPLAALPLTPNGKVDLRALPEPAWDGSGDAGTVAPCGTAEETLAAIWAQVLGVERVGARDDFFELGGDSILSLQIVARAREAGLRLTPRQLFEHPTVAGLAAVADAADPDGAEPGPVTGPVPLTPIQLWLFERNLRCVDHWNQSLFLELRRPVAPPVLARAALALLVHHDALRLRFLCEPCGWRQEIGEIPERAPCVRIDLSALPEARRREALEPLATGVQASLRLATGPIMRFALFHLGGGEPDRLLIAVHHLAVDGVSWRVLLEDLRRACEQLEAGGGVRLPARTASLRRWAERLAAHARSAALREELPFWRSIGSRPPLPLPVDHPGVEDGGAAGSAVTVSFALAPEETRELLQEVPKAYRTRIDEVLLAALARALEGWTGDPAVLIDVEGHGREELAAAELDVSRTVGWFTSFFPLALDLSGLRGPGELLRSVKEQVRRVPARGIGYGLLRFLSGDPEATAALGALPRAQVSFNYLGQTGPALAADAPFVPAAEPAGQPMDPAERRPYLLEVTGIVSEGSLRLSVRGSGQVHRRQTLEALAESFRQGLHTLIGHCLSSGAGGYTPSDFPLLRIDPRELDLLLASVPDVEDAYPLSPMQEGMLFHSLLAPGSGVYVTQARYDLESLDLASFRSACEAVLDRHPVLRTGFHAATGSRPAVQVVRRAVPSPLRVEEVRGLPVREREAWLEALARSERKAGFELSRPPLVCLVLARVSETGYHLVWTHHHLVLDGWSMPLLLGELLHLYGAAVRREPARLPGARPYRDYIAFLEGRDRGREEELWRRALAGFPAPTPLPMERRPAPSAATPEHRRVEIREPAVSWAGLEAFVRRHQLTAGTLVQGAWALLLGCASGSDDVVFGAVSAGRPAELSGVETRIGLFINTLPVRVKTRSGTAVLPWLKSLQAGQLALREAEHTPLVQVQRWSEVPPGTPLFETLLIFENYPVAGRSGEDLGGLEIRRVGSVEQTSYPLNLWASVSGDLWLSIEHDVERLDAVTAQRLLLSLERLLRGLAEDPARPLEDVPMLGEPERHQLLFEWNDTAGERGGEPGVLARIEAWVARAPEAVAVSFEAEALTYAGLDQRAQRLARRLARLGVGPEMLVAVCARRSPALLVALLAVLKAGGAWVPLDPTHPRERLGWILEDSGARWLLTERALLEQLPAPRARVVPLDEDPGEGPAVPLSRAGPENLAYVIYTSGSTGRPKGVEVRHRGLDNYLAAMAAGPGLGAGDVMMAVTTLSFDIAVTELLLPLTVGARIELVSGATAGDASLLAAALDSAGATCLQATPATWILLADGGWRGRPGLKALCGGEALPRGLADRLLPWVGELWNVYGPTETTVWSAALRIGPGEGTVPAGSPLENTALHILGPHGELAPVGAPGELAIGGDGLARGYHGRPEWTAERFSPDPFGAPGARLYHSGDLARRLPDGTLELLGRIDHQVKIRGFRIEPGEIEAVLATHEAVRECVVAAWQDGSGARLVGYVVPLGDAAPETAELRGFLAAKIPSYMIPAAFVTLAALPLSPNGKIDRRALPAPGSGSRVAGEALAPRTPAEEALADVFAEVLAIARPGVEESFFDLGGHSLLAIRLLARLREAFGVELPLRALFDAPTVAELAPRLESAVPPKAPPVVRASDDRARDFAPSFAQQRLWFLDQLEPGNPFYAHLLGVRLLGRLDVPALAVTLTEVVRRHEVLRTTLPAVDGRPVQRIAPPGLVRLPWIDLAGLGQALAEPEFREWSRREAMRPFDLARGPLLRAALFRLAPEESVVLLSLHHVIFDAWSIGLLVREVTVLYEAVAAGRPSPLPELLIQYTDYAEWQRGWLQGEVLDGHLAYWKRQLAGSWKPLELPADRPRPLRTSYRGASLRLPLAASTSRSVVALSRRQGVTPFMTFLAAFDVLLARLTGEEDVVVGMALANRTRVEVEGLIGFFVNMLPLRVDLSGSPTFRDLLRRVREVCLGAQAHQELPLDKLVEAVRPDRTAGDAPLFRIAFGLQNAPQEALELPGLQLRAFGLPEETVRFDLTVWLFETGEGFSVQWTYSTERFDESTLRRLHGRFVQLLASFVERPDAEIDALEMLPAEERRERALLEQAEEASRHARLLQARPSKFRLPSIPS